jgi:hypothetical protein
MPHTIEFTFDDLIKIAYFTLCKFKQDSLHMQGTSAKRDLFGGFLDRWVNRAPEFVMFNAILRDKKKQYFVISDFFLYDDNSIKNAPDVFGLSDGKRIVHFYRFNNGEWERQEKAPHVEVKTLRTSQYLSGVRDPQLDNEHYYAIIESEFELDYMTILFKDEFFDEKHNREIQMDSTFIISDDKKQLITPPTATELRPPRNAGKFSLLGVYKGDEIRRLSTLCTVGINPYYLKSFNKSDAKLHGCIDIISPGQLIYKYKYDEEIEYIPFYIESKDQIRVMKKNKGSMYIESSCDFKLNGQTCTNGRWKLEFAQFDRSSGWDEWICSKELLRLVGNDKTEELLSLFDGIWNNSEV